MAEKVLTTSDATFQAFRDATAFAQGRAQAAETARQNIVAVLPDAQAAAAAKGDALAAAAAKAAALEAAAAKPAALEAAALLPDLKNARLQTAAAAGLIAWSGGDHTTLPAGAGNYRIMTGPETGQVWERIAGAGVERRPALEAASATAVSEAKEAADNAQSVADTAQEQADAATLAVQQAQASLTLQAPDALMAWDRGTLTTAFADGSRWVWHNFGANDGVVPVHTGGTEQVFGTCLPAAGGGFWHREYDTPWAHYWGATADYVWGQGAAARAAAIQACRNPERITHAEDVTNMRGQELHVLAGTFFMPRPITSKAKPWRRFVLRGAGAAHPQSIGRGAREKSGTVFVGENNRIINADLLDRTANESIIITGIGFLNDTDYPTFRLPPVVLRKAEEYWNEARQEWEGRYTCDHHIDISLYNWSQGLTWVGANTSVSRNYIGQMRLRVNSYKTGRPITFWGCTANQVEIENSQWHEVDSPCVYVGFGHADLGGGAGGAGTWGMFRGILRNCHAEGSLGIFEMPGVEIRDDGGFVLRHSIHLNKVTHEFTGRTYEQDKDASGNPRVDKDGKPIMVYKGSQWQMGKNTDVDVSADWDNPCGYGEQGIPDLPATCTLSSSRPITVSEDGGLILSPETVNNGGRTVETVAPGATGQLRRTAGYGLPFDVALTVKINGGADGYIEYRYFGVAENGKKIMKETVVQPVAANITITQEPYPGHTDMYNILVNNGTGAAIQLEAVSRLTLTQAHPVTGY